MLVNLDLYQIHFVPSDAQANADINASFDA